MPQKLLIDTDIIIDYLRDHKNAEDYIENVQDSLLLSVITIAELHVGIRNQEEKKAIDQFLQAFQVIPLTQDIAEMGGQFRRQYGKSHGTGLADALIAATAVSQFVPIVTLNKKHYPMLKEVISPYQK